MSFIQKVKIASVPNGTSTISATGSNPNIATPVVINITKNVIRTQRVVKIKLNNNIRILLFQRSSFAEVSFFFLF